MRDSCCLSKENSPCDFGFRSFRFELEERPEIRCEPFCIEEMSERHMVLMMKNSGFKDMQNRTIYYDSQYNMFVFYNKPGKEGKPGLVICFDRPLLTEEMQEEIEDAELGD